MSPKSFLTTGLHLFKYYPNDFPIYINLQPDSQAPQQQQEATPDKGTVEVAVKTIGEGS